MSDITPEMLARHAQELVYVQVPPAKIEIGRASCRDRVLRLV